MHICHKNITACILYLLTKLCICTAIILLFICSCLAQVLFQLNVKCVVHESALHTYMCQALDKQNMHKPKLCSKLDQCQSLRNKTYLPNVRKQTNTHTAALTSFTNTELHIHVHVVSWSSCNLTHLSDF